jgi:hypothetical protein
LGATLTTDKRSAALKAKLKIKLKLIKVA